MLRQTVFGQIVIGIHVIGSQISEILAHLHPLRVIGVIVFSVFPIAGKCPGAVFVFVSYFLDAFIDTDRHKDVESVRCFHKIEGTIFQIELAPDAFFDFACFVADMDNDRSDENGVVRIFKLRLENDILCRTVAVHVPLQRAVKVEVHEVHLRSMTEKLAVNALFDLVEREFQFQIIVEKIKSVIGKREVSGAVLDANFHPKQVLVRDIILLTEGGDLLGKDIVVRDDV